MSSWEAIKLVWKAIFLFVSRYDIFWPAYISLAPILLLSIYAIYRIGLRIGRSDWDFDRVQRERKKERQKLIEELKQREKEYKQQLESMYEETRKQLMIEFQDRDRQLRQYKEELERYHESLRQRARALDDLEKKLNERDN
jgi:biopolymer transport protein ExbB/TolQ